MAYNYLTQHTHTSNSGWGPLGGGGGGGGGGMQYMESQNGQK